MNRICSQHILAGALTVYTVHGEIDQADFCAAIAESSSKAGTGLVLFDFSSGALAYQEKLQAPDEPQPTFPSESDLEVGKDAPKTALLAPNEIDYGLARLLLACSHTLRFPRQVRTFRSMSAAMRWLGACRLCQAAWRIQPSLLPGCKLGCPRPARAAQV